MLSKDYLMKSQPRILVVDDTPANLHMIASALADRYELSFATNGRLALEHLKRDEKPDLILLDVMMPEMGGFEVCRRIKSLPDTKDIPIIFVTAKDDFEAQQQGFSIGAVDYIAKPIEFSLLQARVNVHIRLKRKSDQLERLTWLDGLTDIPNRRALEDALHRECGRSSREGHALSVLMLDVDHFKAFNDNYGHGEGDNCLQKVAWKISSDLKRPGDFVARYGGEEFVVLLPNCEIQGALSVAEQLRSSIESLKIPHAFSSAAPHLTLSIGVACRTSVPEESCHSLLKEADEALYVAKSQGRNRVVRLET